MNTSPAGLDLIRSFEGLRLSAYQDQRGIWTIGFGSTKDVHEGMTITIPEAIVRLKSDLGVAEAEVNRLVKVPLTQGQFDALVDFTFNLGGGSLEHSTLLKLLNEGKYEQAQAEFSKWDHCAGEVNAGLLRRREAEADMFGGGK